MLLIPLPTGAVLAAALLVQAPPPRAAAPAAPLRLEGQVKDAAGKPVEKARIVARRNGTRLGMLTLSTRSDATGAFTLPLQGAGTYTLRVEAEGLAPYSAQRLTLPGPRLAVVLKTGGSIEGVVKDSRGKPVAGARVEALERGGMWPPGGLDADAVRVRATTDVRGLFRLAGLSSAPQTITASARGQGAARREGVLPGRKLELFLAGGSDLAGTVLGPDGKPVAGASVTVVPDQPFAGTDRLPERTDERGAFQLWSLTPGAQRVLAWHAGMAPALACAFVERRGSPDVTLRLGPPARVQGRLVDGEGRPQRGVVSLQAIDGQEMLATLSDALRAEADEKGVFALDGLPRTSLSLAVMARGFVARRLEAAPGGAPLDLGDVTLERGFPVSGRVVDSAGNGVAEAQVSAQTGGMGASGRAFLETTSEADGRFTLAAAEAALFEVDARADGFAGGNARILAGGAPATIILQRGASITGVVVDEQGTAVPAFEVEALRSDRPYVPEIGEGTDGRLLLENLAPGEWSLQVHTRDGASAQVPKALVSAGVATDVGRVRLLAGASLRGRVTDSSGTPVTGANVWSEMTDRRPTWMRGGERGVYTDGTGSFELRGLQPGKVDVVAFHPDYAAARVVGAEVGPVEVRVVMARGGRIEGTARRRDGRPVEAMQVMASTGSPPTGSGMAQVAPDGTFTFEHLAAGPVKVTLFAGQGGGAFSGVQTRQVTLAEGETASVDFLLRDVLVGGTVTRGGAPAAGVRIAFGSATGFVFFGDPGSRGLAPPASGPQRGWALTRGDGSYELLIGDPGAYFVTLSSADGRTTFPGRQVEVPDADTLAADFAIGGGTVSGVTVDAETGRPLEARVTATPSAGGTTAPRAGASGSSDGHFALELEPGAYTLAARAEGYAPASQEVTVDEGGAADLRFALARGERITGRILNAAGRPLGGMPVIGMLEAEAGRQGGASQAYGMALPDGTFTLSGLLRGSTFTLSTGVGAEGYAIKPGVAAGSTEVLLRLAPGGRVRATVRTADGAPAEGAFVALGRVDGHAVNGLGVATTDGQGSAELAVPAGRLELGAGGPTTTGKAEVTVAAGETAAVDITVQPPPK